MITYRADFRSFLANTDMAAVRTLPDHIAISGKYDFFLNVIKELKISLFCSMTAGFPDC